VVQGLRIAAEADVRLAVMVIGVPVLGALVYYLAGHRPRMRHERAEAEEDAQS